MTRLRAAWEKQSYGVILLAVVASFAFQSVAPDDRWGRLVSVLLQAATLLLALHAADSSPRHMRRGRAIAGAAVLAGIGGLFVGNRWSGAVVLALGGIMIAWSIVVISVGVIRRIRVEGAVRIEAVLGALSVYLLLGLIFAFLLSVVAKLDLGPLFTNGTDGNQQDRIYFSYITLTTVGYGDFSPKADLARTLAVIEALLGQVYLVTVVAIIVGNLGRSRPRREE